MDFAIYTLSDPVTDELRYVGCTSGPLEKRLYRHCIPAELKRRNHRTNWVRSIVDQGVRPKIELVETQPTREAMFDTEIFYIAYFRSLGFRLVNEVPGGRGGGAPNPSPERRAKMSAAHMGKKQSAEQIEKRVSQFRGKKRPPMSQEWKDKIASTLSGHVQTAESRAKKSRAVGGRPFQDQDGRVFQTLSDAAKELGVNLTSVHKTLCGVTRSCKGRIFKYIEEK